MDNNQAHSDNPKDEQDERLGLQPDEFIRTLSQEERSLLTVRDELYEGSWERMRSDLRNRLTGKPYIFKLVNRIEADLAVIELLSKYEKMHLLDLTTLVERK